MTNHQSGLLLGQRSRPAHPSVTIVIPCYQEDEILERSYERLVQAVEGINADWSFLYVDDGSTDGTWEILQHLRATDERVALLRLSRNFGHQAAITAGLDHAASDAAIVLDADLQDPPRLIAEFLERWQRGFDVVFGRRCYREKEPFVRRLATSAFYNLISRSSELRLIEQVADFCLLDRRVVDQLRQLREQDRYLRGLRHWVGFNQCAVEYVREARIGGVSKYTWHKLFKLAFDGLFSFGNPLSMIMPGTLVVCLLVAACLVLTPTGSTSLPTQFLVGMVSAVSVTMILFVLCIIVEYLRRIYLEVKGRPLYLTDCYLPREVSSQVDGEDRPIARTLPALDVSCNAGERRGRRLGDND